MNATMKIITAIAVVSTVVAVVEGVMLLQRPAVAPTVEQEIVVQAPAEDPPVPSTPIDLPIATVPGGKQTPTSPVDVARADAAVVAETGGAASGAEADADTGAAAPELNAELTPEQKRAQERELAKTKLRDAMVLQMEEAANQLLDRLQLDAAQYELAAEPIAKIRQAMVNLAVGQMDKGEQMMQKANQIRQDALLAGQKIGRAHV